MTQLSESFNSYIELERRQHAAALQRVETEAEVLQSFIDKLQSELETLQVPGPTIIDEPAYLTGPPGMGVSFASAFLVVLLRCLRNPAQAGSPPVKNTRNGCSSQVHFRSRATGGPYQIPRNRNPLRHARGLPQRLHLAGHHLG